ncbi:uncharacterized protein I303_100406 [Kwoniella dejecticola CBS 10117]|uniref:Uncharacterized protein n=1 Tax=Kwoniella dejecticola CBS 10117 TaxID=1296121 RepID=A0A1A6AEY5_9TREE|nr:uncharacterized protein I303_00405 [Kwoniella dejecticola CBS 10117]OBR88588.1 hypothetical protein I303_00405 [Kwoniella dejecticola CBS 10117]
MPAVSSTSATASASSSRLSSPAPPASGSGSLQPIDAYRPISTQVKKPIVPLVSTNEVPNLPTLLSLDPSTYSSRLSGKTLQTSDPSSSSATTISSSAISPLVKGKKRNRGYPFEKEKARNGHQTSEARQKEVGLTGMRKVKKRLSSVMCKGLKIDYESLIPLNHLHTRYLFQLLGLPKLPDPVPSTSSAGGESTVNSDVLLSKISKADLTGLKIQIVSSKNPSLIGQNGIIIEETYSTFRLVTPVENRVKVMPKSGSLFRIYIPAYSPGNTKNSKAEEEIEDFLNRCPKLQIDLLGDNFLNKSGDRPGKKLKYGQGGGGGSGWAQEWIKETEWEKTFAKLSKALGESSDLAMVQRRSRVTEKPYKRKRNKSRRKDPPAFGNPG